MKRASTFGLILGLSFCCVLHAGEREPVLCLKGLDPVALSGGAETPGVSEHFSVRGAFKYQFANAGNKKKFDASPQLFAAQYGGSCATTGPLTVLGDPTRFLVKDQLIYLFDKETCQKTFEEGPERFIELSDRRPTATPDQIKEGAKLIERALEGMGGSVKVDAVKSLETRFVLKRTPENRDEDSTHTNTVVFPDSFRREERSKGGTAATFARGANGYRLQAGSWWKMELIETEYLTRIFRRDPLVLLRARTRPEFLAIPDGKGKLGDKELDFVRVWFDGMTYWLGLDQTTNRILAVRYRGRVAGNIGMLVKLQSDFRDVEGVSVAFAASLEYEGNPIPGSDRTVDAITINGTVDPAIFQPPK